MTGAQITSLSHIPAIGVKQGLNHRIVLLLTACAILCMLVLNVFHRESYSGDEGFYGVTALNMLRSPSYVLRPSYNPAGDFLADKDGFAHPPFNSYLYALSLWLCKGSLAAPELVNVLSFALFLYFTFRVISPFDVKASRFTVLLLAASPAVLISFSQLEAEPLMTTTGIIALYCALKASGNGRQPVAEPNAMVKNSSAQPVACGASSEVEQKGWLFLSGLCLGLSFAFKLWLCGPLALAVAAALVFWVRRREGSFFYRTLPLLFFLVGAGIPAGVHLLAIWWNHPEDMSFWLKNIYFGVFTNAGISGSKLAGAGTSSDWVHPVWYYAAALYRDHYFLLPIIVLGIGSALREARGRVELSWIITAGLFGLVPLSLMQVKEPLYVLSCAAFLYFLAGFCLAALTRRIETGLGIDSLSSKLGMVIIPALLILFPLAYARGIQPAKITGGFVLAHTITFSLFLGVFLFSLFKKSARLFESSIFALCAIAIATVFVWNFFTSGPRDKFITRIIRPYLQSNAPDTLSLIASNFKSYQFYSYRHGCYWHELPLQEGPESLLSQPRFSTVRAFIIDPDDLKKPESAPWLSWFETHASEKTAELDHELGYPSGFRVFIREAANHAVRK
jgi:hypothetical protein